MVACWGFHGKPASDNDNDNDNDDGCSNVTAETVGVAPRRGLFHLMDEVALPAELFPPDSKILLVSFASQRFPLSRADKVNPL